MAVFDLFSKRQERTRGETPEVYQYKEIPSSLRVQIVHIIRDSFGRDTYGNPLASKGYEYIHQSLCREYGVFTLKVNCGSDAEAVFYYFLNCKNHEQVLDIVEFSFHLIDTYTREWQYEHFTQDRKCTADDAIEELNARFKEHGIGYQYESGKLIRIDSRVSDILCK